MADLVRVNVNFTSITPHKRYEEVIIPSSMLLYSTGLCDKLHCVMDKLYTSSDGRFKWYKAHSTWRFM